MEVIDRNPVQAGLVAKHRAAERLLGKGDRLQIVEDNVRGRILGFGQFLPDHLLLGGQVGFLEMRTADEVSDNADAERQFGDMAAGPPVTPEPARFVGGWHYDRRKSRQAQVAIGMPAPAWGDSGNFAAQLFADVVGVGASSRLFQELRESQGLAYSVSAMAQPFADSGLFSVYVATDRDDAMIAQQQVERVLAEAAETMTLAELDRAKALTKAAMLMSLESCWGQASYVATRLQREGRLVEPAEIVARLDAVSLDEVRDAGATMLAGPRALASVGGKLARAA